VIVAALIVALLVSGSAWAQPMSFGVRAGVPINGPLEDVTRGSIVRTFSDSNAYVAGVMVELHLPAGFSVEADGLYQPLHVTQQFTFGTTVTRTSDSFNSWVFPIVAKYRFLRLPLAKPYAEAGPSFRAVEHTISYFSKAGLTFGAGIEFKLSKLRIEPELRYTRWGADAPETTTGSNLAPSNVNQVQFLIGLAF